MYCIATFSLSFSFLLYFHKVCPITLAFQKTKAWVYLSIQLSEGKDLVSVFILIMFYIVILS